MRSDSTGVFWFKAITPVPYPIPHDGPVGKLLEKLHRHPYRPSHMHFMFEKEGYDHLITYVLGYCFVGFVLGNCELYHANLISVLSTFAMTLTKHPMQSSASRIP